MADISLMTIFIYMGWQRMTQIVSTKYLACPFSRPEYPSKIIKEKGKYFCFTELDEPELSAEQVYKLTNQLPILSQKKSPCTNDLKL